MKTKITGKLLKDFGFSEVGINEHPWFDCVYLTPGNKIMKTFRVMKHDFGWWFIIDWNDGGIRNGINLGTWEYIDELYTIFKALTIRES